jgi:methylenetetrahydrofolate reductase (NADPH)
MKTSELFRSKQTLSFEIFPPKKTDPVDRVYEMLGRLKDLSPDFISVTYGAGGRENSAATIDIADYIKNECGVESVAHLPGMGLRKADVIDLIVELRRRGIENILALRGDRPEGREVPEGDFTFASDLIEFIHETAPGEFNIIASCYPEGHAEAPDLAADIKNLKRKVDAGADHLITQLFFDNRFFYDFQERIRHVGIEVPVEAGIMPITNSKQISRIVPLCGAALPPKFLDILDRHKDDPDALREAGIEYAIEQIKDLIDIGVDGIHLYTMNDPLIAKKIYEETAPLLS